MALLPSQEVTVIFLPVTQLSQTHHQLESQAQDIYIWIGVLPTASVGQVILSVTLVEFVVAGRVKSHPVGAV